MTDLEEYSNTQMPEQPWCKAMKLQLQWKPNAEKFKGIYLILRVGLAVPETFTSSASSSFFFKKRRNCALSFLLKGEQMKQDKSANQFSLPLCLSFSQTKLILQDLYQSNDKVQESIL